jgi:hypothetical protein
LVPVMVSMWHFGTSSCSCSCSHEHHQAEIQAYHAYTRLQSIFSQAQLVVDVLAGRGKRPVIQAAVSQGLRHLLRTCCARIRMELHEIRSLVKRVNVSSCTLPSLCKAFVVTVCRPASDEDMYTMTSLILPPSWVPDYGQSWEQDLCLKIHTHFAQLGRDLGALDVAASSGDRLSHLLAELSRLHPGC